jgi:hypothetical protein
MRWNYEKKDHQQNERLHEVRREMRQSACFCDLCLGENRHRLAVARYWNEDGEEWHVCRGHLVFVEELGLDYEEFPELGDVEWNSP